MTTLFSVVIPTYNRSDLLVRAVQSVLAQTFDDFEVVVSDNQSADDTHDAIAKSTIRGCVTCRRRTTWSCPTPGSSRATRVAVN